MFADDRSQPLRVGTNRRVRMDWLCDFANTREQARMVDVRVI
jgi:hypothetical protein